MRHLLASALLVGAAACAFRGGPQATAPPPTPELSGCFDVTAAGSVPVPSERGSGFEIPPRIEFSGTAFGNPSATRIVVPEGALPSIHGYTGARILHDSLYIYFSTGFSGVSATLTPTGEGWAGAKRFFTDISPHGGDAGPIELIPVPCDSPPPVSIDMMRPLGRSVTLADGRSITVGKPPPEWLEPIIDEDGNGELTGVGPMQGIFGTPERITVSVRRNFGGIVSRVRLFYQPETDVFGRLEERLRDEYGAPDGTEEEYSRLVRYRNRITDLVLMLLRDPRYLILELRDSRYR